MWNAHAHTGNTCANIQHPNAVCVCHCCGYYYVYHIPEKVDGPVNVAKRASRVTARVAPVSQVGPGLPRDRNHHHTAARQDASSIIATVDVPPAQVPKEMPGLRRMASLSLQILAKNRLLLPSTTILDAHVQKTDGQVARQQWSGAHKRRKYCALWRDPIHLRATVAKDHRGNLRAMAAGLIITGIIMHTNNFSFFCVRGLGHTAHTQQDTPTDGSLQPPQAIIVAFAT
jgi:hypothetical protein